MEKVNQIIEYLKKERKKQKISQKNMADKMNMAEETFRDIESGRIALKLEVFLSICNVLQIQPINAIKNTDDILIIINQDQIDALQDINNQIQQAINYNNIHNNTINGDIVFGNNFKSDRRNKS